MIVGIRILILSVIYNTLTAQSYQSYFQHARKYYHKSVDSCVFYAKKALEASENDKQRADALYFIGGSYTDDDKLALATDNFLQALNLYRQVGDKKYMSDVMFELAIIFKKGYAYDKCLTIYREVLDLKKDIKDYKLIAGVYRNMAKVYRQKGEYDSAMHFNLLALGMYEEDKDHVRTARVLNEIGLVHYDVGNYTKSIDFYFRALDRDRNPRRQGIAYNNAGNAYYELGDYKKAKEYLLKANILKDGKNTTSTINNLAKLYFKNSNVDSALYYLSKVNDKTEIVDRELIETNQILGEYYRDIGDVDNLAICYQKMTQYTESLLKTKNELGRLYSFYELESGIYRHKERIRQEKLYQQQVAISIAIFGFVLVVLILLYSWNKNRSERKNIIERLKQL